MPKRRSTERSLAERAYEYILDKLLRREYAPGQLLIRRDIAEQLKMSIAPVLEAMVRLEAEGLVTSLPRKGTQVRLVRPEDTIDQLTVREAIECQAARMYCGKPIKDNEARLKALAEAVDSVEDSALSLWKREIEFHTELIKLSGSRSLVEVYQQIIHLGTLCSVNFFTELHPANNPAGNHVKLVAKLMTDDPDTAERCIRQHLREGKPMTFPGAGTR